MNSRANSAAGEERSVKISEELARELVELLGPDRVGFARV